MADCEGIPAHQDLFHQQVHDFLPFGHPQRIRPQLQLGTEIRERLRQSPAVGLVGSGRCQRLQLGRLIQYSSARYPLR